MTIEQYFDKYNYEIFSNIDESLRVQFKSHVDEWYDIIQEEESFSIIERMERGKTNLVYQSSKYENCLMYIGSRLSSSKDCLSGLINLREKFKKEKGFPFSSSKNDLNTTIDFLDQNGISKKCYSINDRIVLDTWLVEESGNEYLTYEVDNNFLKSFSKKDTDLYDVLVISAIEKKTLIDFEKEMYEIFNIEAQDIPKEIKENIYK